MQTKKLLLGLQSIAGNEPPQHENKHSMNADGLRLRRTPLVPGLMWMHGQQPVDSSEARRVRGQGTLFPFKELVVLFRK